MTKFDPRPFCFPKMHRLLWASMFRTKLYNHDICVFYFIYSDYFVNFNFKIGDVRFYYEFVSKFCDRENFDEKIKAIIESIRDIIARASEIMSREHADYADLFETHEANYESYVEYHARRMLKN